MYGKDLQEAIDHLEVLKRHSSGIFNLENLPQVGAIYYLTIVCNTKLVVVLSTVSATIIFESANPSD